MTVRSAARTLAFSLLLLACQCGGGRSAITARYPAEQYEITETTQWSSPGLRFYRVVMVGVQDRSSVSIVALDENGSLIEGGDLFHRFASLPPEELAEHACYTLIDGCTPLAANDPAAARWLDGDASHVEAPHLDGGHLVFDTLEGDMAPRVVRIVIDVAASTILSHDALRDVTPPATPPAPATIPASIEVTLGNGAPNRFVTASFTNGSPSTISGCVSSVAGACAATVLVTLDADASAELAQLVGDVLAIPRCEPESIAPDDLPYTMSWPGAPRSYEGHVPLLQSQTAARGTGPCRADARLAFWIARWALGESRAASEMPSMLIATVDVSQDPSATRFVNASVHFGERPLAISGCTSGARGACRATTQVELDAVQSARLRAMMEDVRAEPCHEPFPTGDQALSIEVGLAYDGRCGADASLAWWVAGLLDPTAMHRSP